jgi:hypothetical protein
MKLGNFSSMKTDLTIEVADKLAFQSSIIGATVLVISIVFFYLYLKHAFDIKYPLLPHISINETDAYNIWNKQTTKRMYNQILNSFHKYKKDPLKYLRKFFYI